MSLPTTGEILERIRAAHLAETGERLSDERLAAHLKIGMSRFNRWKSASPEIAELTIRLVAEAGLLRSRPEDQAAAGESFDSRLERAADRAVRVARSVAELLDALNVQLDDSAPPATRLEPQPAPPKRNRRAG